VVVPVVGLNGVGVGRVWGDIMGLADPYREDDRCQG